MYRYNKVDLFLKLTNEMIDSFFPEKRIRLHENDKPFKTGRIKCLLAKRDNAYKQGRSERFKTLRRLISFEICKEKNSFYDEKVRQLVALTQKHGGKISINWQGKEIIV